MNLLIIYGYMMVYFYIGKYVCNFEVLFQFMLNKLKICDLV